MKKLLFLIPFILLSCSKDEANENSDDPIVGTWKPIGNVDMYEFNSYEENLFEESECEQRSRLTFEMNGKASYVEYSEVYEGNEVVACEIEEDDSKIAFWRKLDNTYEYKLDTEGADFTTGEAERIVVIGDELRFIWYEDEEKGEYDYDLYKKVN